MTADDRRLTDLVQAAAETIEPTDRLSAIRARASAEGERRRRRTWLLTGGVSLATAAAVAAVAFAVNPLGADRADDGVAGTPGTSDTPRATDPASPTADATPEPGEQVTVPVYYVGETPQGPRLFREFHRVAAADRLREAARAATGGTPADPDYRSAWGVDVIEGVSFDGAGDAAEYGVSFRPELASDPPTIDPAEAELAIQALVYTIQGAGRSTAPVTFWLDGQQVDSLLGIDTSGGVTRAPPLDVLALVNVTTPEQDWIVTGGTLTASGVASSFEATVPWAILDTAGAQVLTGFATAEGWMDRLYPWEVAIDVSSLPPGDYVFVARTDDPSGGAEGPGPTEDTKAFTIR